MGRANVYLTDDLERRIKAAGLPISEICQRALLAAVEEAENGNSMFDEQVTTQFQRGLDAGGRWVGTATQTQLLTLLRDQRLTELPPEALPHDLYALTQAESLGWEAGFAEGARAAIQLPRSRGGPIPDTSSTADAGSTPGAASTADAGSTPGAASTADAGSTPGAASTADAGPTPGAGSTANTSSTPGAASESDSGTAPDDRSPRLGDDSGCQIGATIDGDRVCFDPHAALRADKSPLFAILGEDDPRARLSFSVALDAASRGTGVILLDLSGELSARASGLGRDVRLISTQLTMPRIDDLVTGAAGPGGLWDTVSNLSSGSGLRRVFSHPTDNLIEPGYVTVLNLSGDGALGTALSAARGLGALLGTATFPRLIQVDVPATMAVPTAVAGRLGQLVRTARQHNIALGISAQSATAVNQIVGSGAPLSTVLALPTSSPAEADRLRTLIGADAPILLNAPGATTSAEDQTWVVMRDLRGRMGQVRIEGS